MNYQTIEVRQGERIIQATLANPAADNAISQTMLAELHALLDQVEQDAQCRLLILRGQPGTFCTGMDIRELATHYDVSRIADGGRQFWALMQRLVALPKVTLALVDGRVSAGGVGLVAACDLVLATPTSQFSLPEALWGLLPCCVLPFLGRRVGFQSAYRLMLTTQAISSPEAYRLQLVDEVCDDLERAVRKHVNRLGNLDPATLRDMKHFAQRLWPLSEGSEVTALEEYTRLLSSPTVVRNIQNYVEAGVFPWEKSL